MKPLYEANVPADTLDLTQSPLVLLSGVTAAYDERDVYTSCLRPLEGSHQPRPQVKKWRDEDQPPLRAVNQAHDIRKNRS